MNFAGQKGTLKDSKLPDPSHVGYDDAQPTVTLPCRQAKRLATVCGRGEWVSVTLKKACKFSVLETGQVIGW